MSRKQMKYTTLFTKRTITTLITNKKTTKEAIKWSLWPLLQKWLPTKDRNVS
jgi:hypothetical protein